ncbi:MAG: restriction endonuclease subunit S [Bacteroidia bacterium]
MKFVKIKDVITEVITGEWGEEGSPEDGVKVIRTTNFTNQGIIDLSKIVYRKIDPKKIEKKKLIQGDVIIEKSGGSPTQPVGRVVYFNEIEENYLCNNFTSVIRPNKNILFPKYFFYALFFKHQRGETLGFQNKTTGIINLKLDNYLNTKLFLPTLLDQMRIAEVLSQCEALIIQREQSINFLEELLKSTFVLRFIDKKFPLVKLQDLTTKITDGEHKKPDYIESGMPFISVKNISKGFLNFADCKYVSIEDHNKFNKRCNPEFEDIIYTKVGATYGRAVVVNVNKPFSLYVSVALIKPDKTKINPYFLKAAINHPFVKRQADKSIKGAGVPDLHLIEIKSFKIPLPPMKEQIEFASIVEKVETLKGQYQESLLELQNMYGVLSQKAFKGELNLSGLNIDHIKPFKDKEVVTLENLIVVPKKEHRQKITKIGKVTVENLYEDGIAKLIKKHFKHLDFRFSEIIKMLEDEEAIAPTYYTTEELKRLTVPNPIDIQTFIFDCVEGKNKHLKLEQKFYNYYDDYELKNINLKESKEELAKKLIGSPPLITGDDINGIYFRIIE